MPAPPEGGPSTAPAPQAVADAVRAAAGVAASGPSTSSADDANQLPNLPPIRTSAAAATTSDATQPGSRSGRHIHWSESEDEKQRQQRVSSSRLVQSQIRVLPSNRPGLLRVRGRCGTAS